MNEENLWFSNNAGVGVGFDDEDGLRSKWHISLDMQGKTVEFPISKELYDEIKDHYKDIGGQ